VILPSVELLVFSSSYVALCRPRSRKLPKRVSAWFFLLCRLSTSNPVSFHERLFCFLLFQGSKVVRLKGGCPSVFSRITQEMAALQSAGIQVDVVPGVSSVLAAPLSAGFRCFPTRTPSRLPRRLSSTALAFALAPLREQELRTGGILNMAQQQVLQQRSARCLVPSPIPAPDDICRPQGEGQEMEKGEGVPC